MKRVYLVSLLIFIALITFWEIAVFSMNISTLVLPSPSYIARTLLAHVQSGYFTPHFLQTLLEVVLGLIIGGGMGFILGITMGEFRFLRQLLMPYVIVSQAVPKLALAPLFILWLGFGITPKIVIVALVCFFPLLENTVAAIQATDRYQLELFRALKASRWQTLFRLKVMGGISTILAGFRVATILALVGAVVAEFIGGSKGLGVVIIASQSMMDTPLMFADLVLLTLLGMLLYGMALALERLLSRN